MSLLVGRKITVSWPGEIRAEDHDIVYLDKSELIATRSIDGLLRVFSLGSSGKWVPSGKWLSPTRDFGVTIRVIPSTVSSETPSDLATAQLRLLNHALGLPIEPDKLDQGSFGTLIDIVRKLSADSAEAEAEAETAEVERGGPLIDLDPRTAGEREVWSAAYAAASVRLQALEDGVAGDYDVALESAKTAESAIMGLRALAEKDSYFTDAARKIIEGGKL